ncbi:hypothetical protein N39L_03830 [Limnospira platensis NIES-39]|uniref:Uncharacterized protein n=1 Tax=Limnospira platensis NIES-46 TaxID=1236695 RepID=A0A5M3T3V7_LIMPL|nr:hypothetical protein N39L_03830 [Arthrospira platensis NIES-39]GCE93547.1 hypothetical protein NIES46_15980 [Arthrospira platensis NIES-46]
MTTNPIGSTSYRLATRSSSALTPALSQREREQEGEPDSRFPGANAVTHSFQPSPKDDDKPHREYILPFGKSVLIRPHPSPLPEGEGARGRRRTGFKVPLPTLRLSSGGEGFRVRATKVGCTPHRFLNQYKYNLS